MQRLRPCDPGPPRKGGNTSGTARRQVATGWAESESESSEPETGDRVVPDFELNYFATVLGVPVCTLLEYEK